MQYRGEGAKCMRSSSELLDMYNGENKDAKITPGGLATAMRSKGFDKGVARIHGVPTNCFKGLEIRMAFELAEDPLGD